MSAPDPTRTSKLVLPRIESGGCVGNRRRSQATEITKRDIPGIALGLLVAALLIIGKAWPEYEKLTTTVVEVIAGVVIVGLVVYLGMVFYDPVSVDRIEISRRGIAYTTRSDVGFIPWADVTRVVLIRGKSAFPDTSGYYNETQWLIQFGNKSKLLGYRWRLNWKLYWAFRINLRSFDRRSARAGLHSWRQGRWICFGEK
ncbi:hypothetical protein [Dyella sp. Tek66A03]|uniref:hypothetical protein n=1 Tax=Dyella sp. Tek66A03 TaxID=3458298 RepID=UPI00403EC220